MDFTIFLNKRLLSRDKDEEMQTTLTLIHETLHYIEFLKGKRSTVEEIVGKQRKF